jgi:hypothetical protein
MVAGTYDIVCRQGSTLVRTLEFYDDNDVVVDLTGYRADMHIRRNASDATAIMTLSSTGGSPALVITANLGKIVLTLTDEQTLALPAVPAVYDLIMTDSNGAGFTVLEGRFVVQAGVTRLTA